MSQRGTLTLEIPTDRPIVGFFLHEICGDVAFWCTEWPQVSALISQYDLLLNGGQLPLSGGGADSMRWMSCRRCGKIMRLNLKYFRAIPRESDLRQKPAVLRRGMKLGDKEAMAT